MGFAFLVELIMSSQLLNSLHLAFSRSTWESRRWEWMNCPVGGRESKWDVAFPGWHLMPLGSLIFSPSPWGNNALLIIICSLLAWQVLSWDFSANKIVQTFVVPSTTFSNPGLTEVITTVLLKGFPFFLLSLTPFPTSSWCYTGISCPFIRSLLQECSLYLILLTWLRYVTWRGVGAIGKLGPESWKILKDYPAHISDYINE